MSILHSRPGLTIDYLTRAEWGVNPDLPRRGVIVAPDRRTEVHVHHTAAVDASDDTPNTWELGHALGYQRRLQTVRPDLGLDIPYSFVGYLSEVDDTVWIMEGRGEDRSGAHTADHNTVGIGFSFGGNFDKTTPAADLQRAVDTVEWFAWYLRTQRGMVNLGTSRNPHGWQVWGHRDTKNKSCPGNNLYPLLSTIDFLGEEPGMADHTHIEDPSKLPRAWADAPWAAYVAAGGSSVPESRVWEAYREDIAWLYSRFIAPLTARVAALEANAGDTETGHLAPFTATITPID